MPGNEQSNIFRKQTVDRIKSPEDLTDYLKVTNPGIWFTLAAVIVLLAGLIVWASVGKLETKVGATVIVIDNNAAVVLDEGAAIDEGMELRIDDEEYEIERVEEDEYGRLIGYTRIGMPDGVYRGKVVTESTHPIDFLTGSGGY